MSTATFRISSPLSVTRSGPAKGLLARFCDAMVAARMRQAMVEIGRHRHLIPERTLKSAGYGPTLTNDASLPFTR